MLQIASTRVNMKLIRAHSSLRMALSIPPAAHARPQRGDTHRSRNRRSVTLMSSPAHPTPDRPGRPGRPATPPPTANTGALGAMGAMFQDTDAVGAVPRRQVYSWALWDWATQPFHSVRLTFVFVPLYSASAG